MASVKAKQYQTERTVGWEIALESNRFADVYSVTREFIEGLPEAARVFGVREAVREARDKDLERELWDH